MDRMTVFGTFGGLVAFFCAFLLFGGEGIQLLQPGAAILVFGGTLAATCVAFRREDLRLALGQWGNVLESPSEDPVQKPIEQIIDLAQTIRKEGAIVMEQKAQGLTHPLIRQAVEWIAGGIEPKMIGEMLDDELNERRNVRDRAAKVFDFAGQWAPQFGVIAMLSNLIPLLIALEQTEAVGVRIANTLVPLVYGLLFSQLFLIPWGVKLRRHSLELWHRDRILKAALCGLAEGVSPQLLDQKLNRAVQAHESWS